MAPPSARKDDTVLIAVLALVVVGLVIGAFLVASFIIFGATMPGPIGGRALGTLVSRSSDGSNWTILVTSVAGTLTTTDTRLSIANAGGATALAPVPLASLDYARDRAAYQGSGGTTIRTGDRILISTSTYPSGYEYQLADSQGVLSHGTFA